VLPQAVMSIAAANPISSARPIGLPEIIGPS